MTNFCKGFFIGALAVVVVFGVFCALNFFNKRDKEILNYAEKQFEIEEMREDYRNRSPDEFIDDIPGVRSSAERAAAEFERKRDEAVHRLRSRNAD